MIRSSHRGQEPCSSSDQSSTNSPANSPQRGRRAQETGRQARATSGHTANPNHTARPHLSAGFVAEWARGKDSTVSASLAGAGSRTLPAGWREILPPNEAWGHSKNRGSESNATRAATSPGAGQRQARAHHSALPDEAGTQTDYRHSYGILPGLPPRTDSTWPTVVIDMESPCGPPTDPMGSNLTVIHLQGVVHILVNAKIGVFAPTSSLIT